MTHFALIAGHVDLDPLLGCPSLLADIDPGFGGKAVLEMLLWLLRLGLGRDVRVASILRSAWKECSL